MKIYTKSGDNGRSSTLNRTSLPKNSEIFELLGNLDELNSVLGLAKTTTTDGTAEIIEQLQKDIMALSAELAGAKKFADEGEVKKLESSIDSLTSVVGLEEGFVVSGETTSGAMLDFARTVARKAERSAVAASTRGGITKQILAYLNRLSDLLYVLARVEDKCGGSSNTPKATAPVTASLDGFLEKSRALSYKVREYARAKGVRAVVAICDAGGNLVSFEREDDALIASIDIAINKAFTSASLKMSTKKVAELAKPDGPLYGIQHTNSGKIVIFGGGEPLMKNGKIVGALGVSGGSAEADTAIAEYGATIFEKEM